ncbi:MAG TPA: hypothetical protein VF845_10725 [Terriglobales bacterium]
MNPKIGSIAKQIRDAKEQLGNPCVLMLGAGASLSSGIRPTDQIMQKLLTQYGADLTEGTLQDRFDRLWARSDQNRRDIFLKRYLDKPPSSGYHLLAELIAQGYFKLVITFNFDQLLDGRTVKKNSSSRA